MRIFDFDCEFHGVFEQIVDSWTVKSVPCPICSLHSRKIPSFRGTISVFKEHFNESFGKIITRADQQRDELKRTEDSIGVKLIQMRPGDRIDTRKMVRDRKQRTLEASEKTAERVIESIAPMIDEPHKSIKGIRELIGKEKCYG